MIRSILNRAGVAAGLALLAGGASAAPKAGDRYAVKAGTVITMAGEPIENGVIVIDGGRITAVGKADEVQIPWDAEVLDVPHLTAFPGFVDACVAAGMDRPNETVDVAPFLDVRDSVDPVNFYFQDALRSGLTTINVQQGDQCVVGGQGMIVKPIGMTVEEMQVRPSSGVRICISPKRGKSRATQVMLVREAFNELRRYLEEVVGEARDGNDRARREALAQGRDLEGENGKGRAMGGNAWKVEGLELVPRGEIDEKQAPLLRVVEGDLPVYLQCDEPMDVLRGLEIAEENGFLQNTTLVIGAECWKVADQIAAAGVKGVVLPTNLVHTERDPITEEETETLVAKVFAEKGVPFSLSAAAAPSQSQWFQAALAVGQGLPREQALAAVTTQPAAMLGLADRVGALKAGADGNVVLFSGDPLSLQSFVEYVVIEGELAYDRSQDTRVRHLLEGVQPEGTSAGEAGVEDVHEEERKAGEGQ